jgi:uncharacterized membrane protein YidH (DUF202 family)
MTAPDDPEDSDPGLARQRTDMAWTRTAISYAAAGAVILKNHLVAGLIVLALGVGAWGLHRLFPKTADDPSRPRRLLLVTVAVTGVALVALGVAFFAQAPGGR